MNNEPWWWPQIIDAAHLTRLREEGGEAAHMGDTELLEYFDDDKELGQFSTTWDNIGDAYEEYAQLAQAFLKLVAETHKTPNDF